MSAVNGVKGKLAHPVIHLEAVTIEGRIQKPNAFYILQRATLSDELDPLKQSFVPRIFQAVDKPPF